MPEPVSRTEAAKTIPGWEDLRPAGEDARYLLDDPDRREAMVKGLRGIADLLEARSDVPIPDTSKEIMVFVDGTIAEKLAQVDHVAEMLGTPVTDNTARGGHYFTQKSFGPVSYEVIATQVGDPAFSVGQDVRLSSHYAAGIAKAADTAQIGYVTGISEEAEGEYSYTVHFPGRAGTQGGWASLLLDSHWFRPIGLSCGQVTSVRDAENLLIDLTVRVETAAQANQQDLSDRDTLCREFAKACGLEPAELAKQVRPQVDERIRSQRDLQKPKTAPELVAGDGTAVAAVPAQAADQPAPVPGSPVHAPAPGTRR